MLKAKADAPTISAVRRQTLVIEIPYVSANIYNSGHLFQIFVKNQ
jgi:hypothetical protein